MAKEGQLHNIVANQIETDFANKDVLRRHERIKKSLEKGTCQERGSSFL